MVFFYGLVINNGVESFHVRLVVQLHGVNDLLNITIGSSVFTILHFDSRHPRIVGWVGNTLLAVGFLVEGVHGLCGGLFFGLHKLLLLDSW
jgi:hypothetical protein